MERMHQRRQLSTGLVAALIGASAAQGCTTDEKPTSTSTSTSGTGGGATATSSSTTTGTGGAGGATTTGSGGGGAGGVTCLDPSASASFFTLSDPSFCVVAIYETDTSLGFADSPTWGAHGGPLTLQTGKSEGTVDLLRWKLPAGTTGKLTAEVTHLDAMIPPKTFLGGQAFDLPFFGWTAFSWTGAFPNTQGEILLVKGATVDQRYPVNGAFALAGGATDPEHGRLLYAGLSALADAATNSNGLYAADSCGTSAKPALLPGPDPTCKAPLAISTWGEASGPVAVDRDGNAFAVMSSFSSGTQEARGFTASTVARGQGATDGTKLFTLPGFGSSIAALAPTAKAAGVVIFQPFNPTTYEAEDVIAQAYSVASATLKAEGSPATFIKPAKSNTSLSLMRDADDRLWVGVPVTGGSTFAVLAHTP